MKVLKTNHVKTKKLSLGKIKELLNLFKYIVTKKPGNRGTVFKYLDDKSINSISESIYNLLYNVKLNLTLSKPQKSKIKRIVKPSIRSFEDISKKKTSIGKRRNKITQNGAGIGTILLTLIPILTSFLAKK